MSRLLKHFATCLVTGFLLLAVSGLTIAVHHEHAMGNTAAQHELSQPNGIVLKTTPRTYHEVHIVKLLSGDSFNGSQKIDLKTSFAKLFTVQLDSPEFSAAHLSSSLANIDIKETGPPSVDRCVLF